MPSPVRPYDIALTERLFDFVPNIAFFAKDLAGKYIAANRTLVDRCCCRSKGELIGRTVADFFPAELAATYAAQDTLVLRTGRSIVNKLELHLYTNRRPGWCLTTKFPLTDATGKIAGLAGLSRDIAAPGENRNFPAALADAIDFLHENFDQPIAIRDLAAKSGLTPVRFGRLIRRLFQLSPGQLLTQTRLQAAALRLRETADTVASIAHGCGFSDHSAFTRQFKATTGLTPLAYRRTARDTHGDEAAQ